MVWCPSTPEPKRFSKMSNVLRALSRSFVFFPIAQLRAMPSKLLVSALQSCFFERFSYSNSNFITSIQVSMQPSDSSLYDFGFLSVLRDLSPLSVDFDSLVINVSRDLFNGSNIEAYIVVSCETVVKSGTDLTCCPVGETCRQCGVRFWRDWIRPTNPRRGCPRSLPLVRLKTCSQSRGASA